MLIYIWGPISHRNSMPHGMENGRNDKWSSFIHFPQYHKILAKPMDSIPVINNLSNVKKTINKRVYSDNETRRKLKIINRIKISQSHLTHFHQRAQTIVWHMQNFPYNSSHNFLLSQNSISHSFINNLISPKETLNQQYTNNISKFFKWN